MEIIAWFQGHPWLTIPALFIAGLWCLRPAFRLWRESYWNSPGNPESPYLESELPLGSPLDEALDDSAGPAATPAP